MELRGAEMVLGGAWGKAGLQTVSSRGVRRGAQPPPHHWPGFVPEAQGTKGRGRYQAQA